jgi:tRNA(Ile)-lysidine synthase
MERHGFLEGVMRSTGASRIALGHTRSDQAETLLLRLMRGSGRRGLGAIRPVREGVWIRPLLSVSRGDVEAYVSTRSLEVRRDRTNSDTRYLRNRVRRDLLPYLEAEYAPGIEGVLARTADILQQEEDLLSEHTESALKEATTYSARRKIVLDTKRVIGYHIAIQRRLLRAALSLLDMERVADDFGSVQGLLGLLSNDAPGVQITPEISAQRFGDRLILSRQTPPFQVRLSVPGHTEIPSLDAAVDVRVRPAHELRQHLRDLGPFRACFDRAALPGELAVRSRRPGDRIRPYGMPGSRKVSDLLIDGKIPKPLRDEVPVLVSGDSVLWVVGLRTAQPFCVSERTSEVVEVEFKGGWMCYTEPELTRKR